MYPVVYPDTAKELDHRLIAEYGLSESALIDSAARNVLEASQGRLKGRLVFLIGPGNNGSDGLEMARLCKKDGLDVSICYLYAKGNRENLRRREAVAALAKVDDAKGFDTVIDAMFGFSFHGEPDERTKAVVESITGFTIAIDVPSAGIVRADLTVTLMSRKAGLYLPSLRAMSGEIEFRNPGFPEKELETSPDKLYLLTYQDSQIRKFSLSDYKNTRGHLLIIGGSDRYTGAPRLAARSAFAAGAGLVSIMTSSEKVRDENPAVMIVPPGGGLERMSAIALGPGWDEGDDSLLSSSVESGKPLVIDADALRHAHKHKYGWRAVLTPHVGEYKRLMNALGLPSGLEAAETLSSSLRALSKALEAVVVLKASTLWITSGDEVYIYDGAEPSLGVAGSGDVLTGAIGALLGEGESPLRAAIDGVILHQRAGKRAHADYGYYSAEELILSLGRER